MDESKKKPIMIAVIILCLVVAGLIAFKGGGNSGTDVGVYKGIPIWLKCANPDCEAEYEMDKAEYLKWVQENMSPAALGAPPMPCKECGEPSAEPAVKCEECELIFFKGSVPNDYADKCPECGFSKIEERRKGNR